MITYEQDNILHGLSTSHLVAYPANPKVKLTKATLEAFLLMQEAAKSDGIDLQIASGFRDFARQNTIYSEKFQGKRPVLDLNEQPIDITPLSDAEKIRAILFFSAIPGFSRHHFGTDLDVYDASTLNDQIKLQLTNEEYTYGSQQHVGTWLTQNIQRFGFFRPYQATSKFYSKELWHISFAKEADKLIHGYDLMQCLQFIDDAHLLGAEALKDIVSKEFAPRFLLTSTNVA